jgi:hypothetical protein
MYLFLLSIRPEPTIPSSLPDVLPITPHDSFSYIQMGFEPPRRHSKCLRLPLPI